MATEETDASPPDDSSIIEEESSGNGSSIQTRGSIRFKEPHKLIAYKSSLKKKEFSRESDLPTRPPKKLKMESTKRPFQTASNSLDEINPTKTTRQEGPLTTEPSDMVPPAIDPILGYSKPDPSYGTVVRPATRHHLIDVHGLALFLRKTVRCFNCYCTNSLSMMGNTSRQEQPVVTRITLKCQNCSFSMYQDLLKPKPPDNTQNSSSSSKPEDCNEPAPKLKSPLTPNSPDSSPKINSINSQFKIPLPQCRMGIPPMVSPLPSFLMNPCFPSKDLASNNIPGSTSDEPKQNNKREDADSEDSDTEQDESETNEISNKSDTSSISGTKQPKQYFGKTTPERSGGNQRKLPRRIAKQRLDLRDARIISQLLDLTETLRNELAERSHEIANDFLTDEEEPPNSMERHFNGTSGGESFNCDIAAKMSSIKTEADDTHVKNDDDMEALNSEASTSWRFRDISTDEENETSKLVIQENQE